MTADASVGTMAWRNEPDDVRRLLAETTVWAVVGLTANAHRTAYSIARYLQQQGKTVVPVSPDAAGATILGETGYASLGDVPFHVDVVDVFRRSSLAGVHVDEAVAIGADGVWLQLGVVDEAAGTRARAAGLTVVQDTCPHIEGPPLLGWPR